MILGLFFGGLFVAYRSQKQPELHPPTPIQDAIQLSLSLPSLDGKSVSLDDLKGKIVIIDFWATWCPPCVAEVPHFVSLQKRYGDQVQVIGVSIDKSVSPVRSFYTKHGLNYPVVMYDPARVKGFGDISEIPTTFILDKDARVVKRVTGYRGLNFFESQINNLL